MACGRQAEGNLNKCLTLDLWKAGEEVYKELEFRSWYCGRQGGEKFK